MWWLLWNLACSTPPADPLRELDARLEQTVQVLRAAEAPIVDEALASALARGDLQEARSLAATLPESARTPQLQALLDPAPPPPEPTPARYQGITLEHGLRALQLTDLHLVEEPAWSVASAAGDQALAALHPDLPPLPPAEDLAGAQARLGYWAAQGGETAIGAWVEAALYALDRRSKVAWPADLQGFEAHHAGVHLGVGVELTDRDDQVVVRWPLPGGPAFHAGVHQGDHILAVDGVPVAQMQTPRSAQVSQALVGDAQSEVTLSVRRADAEQELRIERGPVVFETITGWTRRADNTWDPWLSPEDGVAYVRVVAFRPTSEAAFDELLRPILGEVRGLILDLRGCPGGDMDAAVQIADRFIAEGSLVTLEGRVLPPPPEDGFVAWNHAIPGHGLEGVPVAVLVDHRTASSAEVLAGTLKVMADATLIGDRTVGKGSSQRLETDPELGFAVQVTNLRWTLPNGERIDGIGLTPELLWPLGAAGTYQITAMQRHRALPRAHADGSAIQPDLPAPRSDLPVLEADPHVTRAHRLLRDQVAGD